MSTTKEELVLEGALILEQEGWLVQRMAREYPSRRIEAFADRYFEWQQKVNSFRKEGNSDWPVPPDNS